MDRQCQKTKVELRKEEVDKYREKRGTFQRKRLHILQNPEKLAFRGWKDVPEPWTLANCYEYIEWCHIGKVFPEDRHNKHRRFNKANLKYCLNAKFKQRCIEVYQILYNQEFVHRNEASLTICRMVWVELKLGKMVDWRTLKAAPGIHIPIERDIPRGVLKFPGGGLSIRRTQVEKLEDYETSDSDTDSDSDPDSDSDGSQPLKLSNNPAAVASKRLRMKKRGHDDEQLPLLHPPHLNAVPHISGASNTASAINTVGAINTACAINAAGASSSNAAGAGGMLLALALQGARNMAGVDNNPGTSGSAGANQPFLTAYPGNPRDNLRMLEIRANMDAFATPPVPERALCGSNTIALWRRRSKQKDEEIQALILEMDALLKETIDKSVIIADQKAELDRLRSLFNESTTANVAPPQGIPAAQLEDTEMEVDVVALDHVVENATYILVEPVTTPLGRRRANVMPPPLPTQQPLHIEETQDSLLFPLVDEVGQLQASNSELKNRIAALREQYYQWKFAYILTVDKNRQMASEYKKIDNEYLENNSRRDFGLTSWAHTDELFPWTLIKPL
jgi:hypothetical protein